ncbi:spore germination protein [Guptibacillus hwajinpoensis]|uniref:Spore germination protein KA n=1 Tax=Guptibacillus hwajinpoensis TaxID=208199 RepID=A0ABU0K2Q1_9BACL|nr:spore germination protein [Alkalihalobacillus hemicentroti]MDQ0483637.1 spore germination protein KA [Alkalihalobacillus hemicentroti]
MKRIRQLGERRKKRTSNEQIRPTSESSTPFYSSLEQNINEIKKTLGDSSDLVVREFKAGTNESMYIAVLYTDGLADKTLVQDFIIEPLMLDIRNADLTSKAFTNRSSLEILKTFSISSGEVTPISDFDTLYQYVLSGDTAILIDGDTEGVAIDSKGWEDRGVNEPTSQTVIRGPKDGFTETLRTNTALIRRKIKDPNLWIETKQIGTKTQTDVSIIYLNGVVDPKLVDEVRERLSRIDIDGILESMNIEELIQDGTYSPFPTIFNSERPDTVAAGILEGRIAIVIDGTPFALLVPALFVQFFQSSEDYYQRFDEGILIRLLRYLSFFLALLTPSAYIAVTTFHQEMLPTPLLISLAAQREGIPFPALLEAVLMELTFEILREAGVRMPRAVGSAISIVGALVLGQAAVEAGIVSNAMVIVVSITAISSFVMPAFNMSISVRILRFPFMILAATFGLFGIILGLIGMVLHLCSLRSFGVPYMSPMAPLIMKDQKDGIFRAPLWALRSRPTFLSENSTRNQTPSPKPDTK